MDRAVVRSIQVFLTVFLALAVFTVSGRAWLADGADHSALAAANSAIGDLLVLFVALGLIWVLPNRVMRGDVPRRKKASGQAASWSEAAPHDDGQPGASGERLSARKTEGTAPANRVVGDGGTEQPPRREWSPEMMLVAIVPALLILAVGVVLYLR